MCVHIKLYSESMAMSTHDPTGMISMEWNIITHQTEKHCKGWMIFSA